MRSIVSDADSAKQAKKAKPGFIEGELLQSRRKMLMAMAGAGGATLLGRSILPQASQAQNAVDPRTARIVANTFSVDMHNHVSQPAFVKAESENSARLYSDLSEQMKKSGMSSICLTYAVDSYRSPQLGDWHQYHLQALHRTDRILAGAGIKRALNMTDIKAAAAANTPIVIQDCEGAQWIEGRLGRIEEAYKRGLRHLQLLHQMQDIVAPLGGIQQLMEPVGPGANKGSTNVRGLTPIGVDVIKECNRLGIIVDMAHADEETVLAALDVAQQPLVVSHTALDNSTSKLAEGYTTNPGLAKRLVSENYVKAVAEAGGVVGVWHTFPTLKDFVTGIKQMADVAGVDHTGIGTDTSMEKSGSGTNAIWPDEKGGFLYAVVSEMLTQGFRPDEISQITGANYFRIFEKVTSSHA